MKDTNMEIILSYSEIQLDLAVDFISNNNPSFLGEKKFIRSEILKNMEALASTPDIHSLGTMGFILTCDCEYEGIDRDENICRVEIHVDPALGRDYDEDAYIEKVIQV